MKPDTIRTATTPRPGRLPETSSSAPELGRGQFVNRELSWLQFNRRVLDEALDASNLTLDRVKFLAIASTNLDEFFEIRVAGSRDRAEAGLPPENPEDLSPREELSVIKHEAARLAQDLHVCFKDVLVPALEGIGIHFASIEELDADRKAWIHDYFDREVYPVLTPLAVDPAHPFPSLLNKSLNIALLLLDPRQKRPVHRIAVVQVPRALPRLLRIPSPGDEHVYVFMVDLVSAHIESLFPGLQALHVCSFRVTRDSNIDYDEESETTDLMEAIEQELSKRRRGEPVRLEISQGAHPEILKRFLEAFELEPEDVHFCDGPVNLGRLMELYRVEDASQWREPAHIPVRATSWDNPDSMFTALRERDILVHLPYESFASVEDFFHHAARDPRVLAIKHTIYRAGETSPIVRDLIRAAENRKQVTVVVELKARFDEEANIRWAKRMERAGVHVVYGIVSLKTHAKASLVVRREEDGIRRYCHLGSGNYNAATARLYTDIGLFTADPGLCKDVADLFNMITGYSTVPAMRHLVVAPYTLRPSLVRWIRREVEHHKAGRKAGIQAKLNALVDPEIIQELYEASKAGVSIELCVRSACCLRPGVAGLSENIRVTSIVDRFLEHSRIYRFENGGEPEIYGASADWMQRNLNRRVEACFPILDPVLAERLTRILRISLEDNVKARLILPDGRYRRIEPKEGEEPRRSQDLHIAFVGRKDDPNRRNSDHGKSRKRKKK
jgi:polyphosphate kinase